ncbi:MAG TPA: AAA family ATPase [Chitinophagaceae bacterium]|jgi:NadR type nicotinamide-nucleotide adenylyltransferase|nr:AAA family ATPase [Chitinophagaceae bacterium]
MEQKPLIKIAVIGPESTGKSTLCELLAQHYNTQWCPEFAREFLLTHGTDYTYDDLQYIAKGQLAMEDEYTQSLVGSSESGVTVQDSELQTRNSKILFIDTEMYVMKVWCEFVFGKCHRWVLDQIVERKYDLYLLCNTDLPWVKDELREYPDLKTRDQLYHIYKDIMINQLTPWVDINGDYDERLQTAIKAIDQLMAG